jgi:hypothetical protein
MPVLEPPRLRLVPLYPTRWENTSDRQKDRPIADKLEGEPATGAHCAGHVGK